VELKPLLLGSLLPHPFSPRLARGKLALTKRCLSRWFFAIGPGGSSFPDLVCLFSRSRPSQELLCRLFRRVSFGLLQMWGDAPRRNIYPTRTGGSPSPLLEAYLCNSFCASLAFNFNERTIGSGVGLFTSLGSRVFNEQLPLFPPRGDLLPTVLSSCALPPLPPPGRRFRRLQFLFLTPSPSRPF